MNKIEIDTEIKIMINYSCGSDHLKNTYHQPRSGIHFIIDKSVNINKRKKIENVQL